MADDAVGNVVLERFLFGQYGNLFKFSLWWITLAPLTFALLDNSSTAVGVGRIVYNCAMCILSPIGAIVVERYPPKRILIIAAVTRFILWCVCLPALWVMQAVNDDLLHTEIFIGLCIVLFVDGAAVALSTMLDVDVCGVDIVGGAYGIKVTEEARNSFNSRAEMFFSLSFIFFAPLMSWGGLLYQRAVRKIDSTWEEEIVASGTLTSIFAATFLLATVWQLVFFLRMPNPPPPQGATAEYSINDDGFVDIPAAPPLSFAAKVREALSELRVGLQIFKEHPPVLFRVLFLGLEIAVEDAVIVVIAAQCGVHLPWMGNGDAVDGNIWAAMSVCAGKIGAAAASFTMLRKFKPPVTRRGFWPLFSLVAIAAVTSGGFPLVVYLEGCSHISELTARILYFTTFVLFFFFSTLPKVGFMCLLQTMVTEIPNGHRAFGFIGIVATTMDAAIIMAMTIFFDRMSMLDALVASFGLILGHGVIELIFGPVLVLGKPAPLSPEAGSMLRHDSDTFDSDSTAGGSPLAQSLLMQDDLDDNRFTPRTPRTPRRNESDVSMQSFRGRRAASLLTDD